MQTSFILAVSYHEKLQPAIIIISSNDIVTSCSCLLSQKRDADMTTSQLMCQSKQPIGTYNDKHTMALCNLTNVQALAWFEDGTNVIVEPGHQVPPSSCHNDDDPFLEQKRPRVVMPTR